MSILAQKVLGPSMVAFPLVHLPTSYMRRGMASMVQLPPLVVCGPSGVGKGTILGLLQKDVPGVFKICISHTTRPPRQGEIDGVHYHFVKEEEMRRGIENGIFLEHVETYGNLYGTSLAEFKSTDPGAIATLEIDTKGHSEIKSRELPHRAIAIIPPNIAVLEERIRNRNSENAEELRRRLGIAYEEIEYCKSKESGFDAVIENFDSWKVFPEFKNAIKELYPSLRLP